MRQLTREKAAALYVSAVTAAGLGVLAVLAVRYGAGVTAAMTWPQAVLVLGVVIGELVPIKLGPDEGEVTPSTSFTFALLISTGLTAAVLAHSLGSLIADLRNRKPAQRIAFNIAQYTLALAASSFVLDSLTSLGNPVEFTFSDVPAFVLAAGVFFALNSCLVATAIALHSGVPLRRQLRSDLMFHSGTEGILLGMAPLAVLAMDYAPILLPLVALPLLAAHRAGRHAILSERLALHDSLTGLPNRILFRERTAHAIEAGRRNGDTVAVMLIDVDRFKEVNDTLGHHVGDEVLRQVSARLRETLRAADTVARLGGDEFAILLDPVASPQAAADVAAKLRDAASLPIDIAGIRFPMSASIGLAWFPEHGEDVDVLMRRADVAMYHAKTNKTGVEGYVEERDDNSVRRLTMAGALSRALDDDLLEAHFQPQIDTRTGATVGVEALARWRSDEGHWIPPDEFIPVAEHTGLIVPLTLRVLECALHALAHWRFEGHDLTVSVNLSPRSLAQADLPEQVAALCEKHGVPPSRLVLEITESMAAADPHVTIPVVERLAALGATISVDDFGTGFSSLDSLKRLPVGELKIDRSFVSRMSDDGEDAAIVRFAIELGHSLGMRVVAEGVETASAHAALARLDCDVLQGYRFSVAVPPEQLVLDEPRRAVLRVQRAAA